MREREIHKYFIESLVINDENNPRMWDEADWSRITKGHAVIGYLFSTKKSKFGVFGKTLNLYLINRKFYRKSEVSLNDLRSAEYEFEQKCVQYPNEKQFAKRMVFKNPPIEEWLATKDNWIAKTAKEFADGWQITYDEALSSVYFIIAEFYHRGDIYMGNLHYIYIGVLNKLRMKERHDKNRLYGKNVISGESPRYVDKDGNVESWFDTIGTEDPKYLERDYNDFVDDLKRYMSKDFSPRELDQIFTVPQVSLLPQNLYHRLLRWRSKHTKQEVLANL